MNGKINAYLANLPFKLIVRDNPYTAQRSFVIKQDIPIPDAFSLILGDAIHNLHSALDIVLFGMISDKAPRPDNISFPFTKKAESLYEAIKNRQADFAGKNVVGAIKLLKPYPTGNDLLYSLHALDIADKHKLILAIGSASDLSADDFRRIDPSLPIFGPGVLRRVGGYELITIERPKRHNQAIRSAIIGAKITEYKPQIQPVFQICFSAGDPFAGQPIIKKLYEMVVGVSEACEILVTEFLKPDT